MSNPFHHLNSYPSHWSEPVHFDLNVEEDALRLSRELGSESIKFIHDRGDLIADELFEVRHPELMHDTSARKEYIDDYLHKDKGDWFYYDWLNTLVRFANKADHQDLRTYRNRELITHDEQATLLGKRAVVFGLSVGSNILDQLIQGGLCGSVAFGDYDRLAPTNLNRLRASMLEVGMNKTDIAARSISQRDPYIHQVHYREGLTDESLHDLGSYKPHIIFDEIDDMQAKLLLRDRAKELATPLVMVTDLADKTIVDVERYDIDQRTQPFHGVVAEKSLDSLRAGQEMTEKERRQLMMKIVGVRNLSPRMVQSALKIGKEVGGLPQLGTTANAGGSLGSLVAREIFLGRGMDSGRYISSPKRVLSMKPQTTARNTVKIISDFIKQK